MASDPGAALAHLSAPFCCLDYGQTITYHYGTIPTTCAQNPQWHWRKNTLLAKATTTKLGIPSPWKRSGSVCHNRVMFLRTPKSGSARYHTFFRCLERRRRDATIVFVKKLCMNFVILFDQNMLSATLFCHRLNLEFRKQKQI